jgi:hypothetical protein
LNNYGFEVQVSLRDSVHFVTLPNSFVPGHGTTNEPHTYRFVVNNPPVAGYYRLRQIDLDGTVWHSEGIFVPTIFAEVSEGEMPKVFALHQSYPNPFNPSTTIGFDVPVATHVSVEVFNMIGEKMTTLVNEVKLPGRYRILFNGDGMSSGLYFYRMRTSGFVSVRQMVLMK